MESNISQRPKWHLREWPLQEGRSIQHTCKSQDLATWWKQAGGGYIVTWFLLLWTILSPHPCIETCDHEEQPHSSRHLLGLPVSSYCCGQFYQLLPSLLVVWITARKASIFQHIQKMQLPCAGRWAQADHGRRMWALCQFHRHTKPGMADVHGGDRCWLCSAALGSAGCRLRMLHGRAHL